MSDPQRPTAPRWVAMAAAIAGVPALGVVAVVALAMGADNVDGAWRTACTVFLGLAIAGLVVLAAGPVAAVRRVPPPRPAKLVAVGTTIVLAAGVLAMLAVVVANLRAMS